jgi:hypothetical protein
MLVETKELGGPTVAKVSFPALSLFLEKLRLAFAVE